MAGAHEPMALAKMKDKYACQTIKFKAGDEKYKQYITDCEEKELAAAIQSQQNALKVLDSCRRNFNHACLINASNEYEQLCQQSVVNFEQTRYAILSPCRVKSLEEVMAKIQFKKDIHPDKTDTFAYVYPRDKSYTIYLCPRFWKASDKMCVDCKMGTLIHEVSHFLGTEDITYKKELAHGSYTMRAVPRSSSGPEKDKMQVYVDCYFGRLSTINANNLEYEFEIGVNHGINDADPDFKTLRHACCGSKEEHSVCHLRMMMLKPAKNKTQAGSPPDETFDFGLDHVLLF